MTDTIDATGITYTDGDSNNAYFGLKITPNKNCTLIKVTKTSLCTGVYCYLIDAANNILDSPAFVGDEATFNYDLVSGTDYYIGAGDGASFVTRRFIITAVSYPIVGTNIDYTASGYFLSGTWNVDGSNRSYNFDSVTTRTADPVVTTTTTTKKGGFMTIEQIKEARKKQEIVRDSQYDNLMIRSALFDDKIKWGNK
jgi:hypothetical protein